MEAARRAISSPLLEGASVNGARGVIINVTGGTDLSLVEVSEASSIVQEAADEDANIIFGAVIDPTLQGKVKITVIATGFGAQANARPVPATASAGVTPVDMTAYADYAARTRNDAVPVPAAVPAARMSIARRPLLDIPIAANGGTPIPVSNGAGSSPSMTLGTNPTDGATHKGRSDGDTMRAAAATEVAADPDFDLSSTFDVPAFLRRQEG
jgi:hypothetical protein